ncbi:MAG: OmpW family outer membrane protein [Acidobacteriota bacterium]
MRLSLILGTMILLQCPLLAQYPQTNQQRKWEFSFLLGVNSAGDTSSLTPVSGETTPRLVGLEHASGYLVGVRITENLGDRFGAELEYNFANQPMVFVNLSPALPHLDLDHRAHSLDYNILYYLTPANSKLRPYAVGGIGTSYYQIDGNSRDFAVAQGLDLKNRWKLAGTWGGGVKYYLGNQWGIRFDVRDQITGVPDYGLPHTASSFQGVAGAAFRPDGLMHTWQFSAGFLVVWNGS